MPSRHFVWAGADTWFDEEGAHSRYRTFIRVAPEVVFDYVSDVRRHPEWTANRMTVTPLNQGSPAVGSRYRTIASQAGRDWESTVEITVFDRPHMFEFIAIGGATQEPSEFPHRHSFTFRAVDGGTEMELHRRSRGLAGRPLLQRLMLWFGSTRLGEGVVNRFAKNIAVGQENIKRNLEAQTSS